LDNKEVQKTEVFVPEAAPKVDARMLVRLLVLVVALLNAVAALFGKQLNIEVNQDLWYQIISAAMLIGSSLWTAWKNNDVTKQARIKAEVTKQVEVKK
jgi:SPP1 family holin